MNSSTIYLKTPGHNLPMRATLGLLVTLIALAMAASVKAQPRPGAAHERLAGLRASDRATLEPLLAGGPVALVEFAPSPGLPAINVLMRVQAPAEVVASVIGQPEHYPRFIPMLDEVEILSRQSQGISYRWEWQAGLLSMEGNNRMTIQAPPAARPTRGYRIAVHSEGGQLGKGRMLWRVFPDGPDRALLSLAMRLDLRDANLVMQQLKAASRSINRSLNLAFALVLSDGTRREAERRAGRPVRSSPDPGMAQPSLDLRALRGLLGRGDLLWLQYDDQQLQRLTMLGRSGTKVEHLRRLLTSPEVFGKHLLPGSKARVTSRTSQGADFEWGIGLPLIGMEGTLRLQTVGPRVEVQSVHGAMRGGRWHFVTPSLPGGEGLLMGWARFDVRDTTWLVRKVSELDPMMGHGLAAASQVMVMRALRSRATKEKRAARAKQRRAAAQRRTREAQASQ